MQTNESQRINNWLAAVKVPLTDKPVFKLSWSEDLYELRRADWPIYADESQKIIVAYSNCVKRAKKYNWIKDRWLLEQFVPPEFSYNEDLPDSKNGDYTCIYVFESSEGKPLELRLDIVQRFVKFSCCNKTSYAERYNALCGQLEKKEKTADRIVEDCLNSESYLVSQFHSGSAILNGFDRTKKEN